MASSTTKTVVERVENAHPSALDDVDAKHQGPKHGDRALAYIGGDRVRLTEEDVWIPCAKAQAQG